MAIKGNKYGTHRVIEPQGVPVHDSPEDRQDFDRPQGHRPR